MSLLCQSTNAETFLIYQCWKVRQVLGHVLWDTNSKWSWWVRNASCLTKCVHMQ